MINFEHIAKAGYGAYGASTGNKNFRGEEMPKWEDLPVSIQAAWIAASRAVCATYDEIMAD